VRLAAAALVLSLTGCATGFTSSSADWAAYRATRVAPTLEDRLAAAQRYLADHPDGAFRAEVGEWFSHADDVYFASKKDSRAGLEAYLSVLPGGPHKDQAQARLDGLNRLKRAEMEQAAAERAEARIAGPAAAARARVRDDVKAWLARFLDPAVFRTPFPRTRAEVIVPFSLSLPPPRCATYEGRAKRSAAELGFTAARLAHGAVRRCIKLVDLPYEIEQESGTEPREATLEITVFENAAGVPVEVTVGGPDLFLRLEETYRVRALAADDPADRVAALARATKLVDGVFGATVSTDDACQDPPIPPSVLRRACGGVHLDVIPGEAAGQDDRIVITP
jgi:hypothetical protein